MPSLSTSLPSRIDVKVIFTPLALIFLSHTMIALQPPPFSLLCLLEHVPSSIPIQATVHKKQTKPTTTPKHQRCRR